MIALPLPPRPVRSAVLKILAIGILGCCLLIPLPLVWARAERATRRDEVVAETTASVGRAADGRRHRARRALRGAGAQPNGVVTLVTRHAYIHARAALDRGDRWRRKCGAAARTTAIVYRTTVR
jgi:hypothetical protein